MSAVLFPEHSCDKALCKIAAGDTEALTVIYDALGRQIYSIAYSVVKNRADAEDIMQETFVKILDSAVSYRPESNARAWVLTITKNLALSFCRKNSRVTDVEEFPDIPDEPMKRSQERMELEEALGTLTDEERMIIHLTLEAELTEKQAAETMNVSLSTLHRKYNSAVEKLKYYDERGEAG